MPWRFILLFLLCYSICIPHPDLHTFNSSLGVWKYCSLISSKIINSKQTNIQEKTPKKKRKTTPISSVTPIKALIFISNSLNFLSYIMSLLSFLNSQEYPSLLHCLWTIWFSRLFILVWIIYFLMFLFSHFFKLIHLTSNYYFPKCFIWATSFLYIYILFNWFHHFPYFVYFSACWWLLINTYF